MRWVDSTFSFLLEPLYLQKQNHCTAAPCLSIYSIYSRYSWILPRSFFFFKDSLFCGSPKAQRCSLLVFQRSTIWFSGSAGKVGVFEGSETKSLSPAFIPAAVVPLSCLFKPCSCSVFYLYLVYYHMILLHEALQSEASDAF